MTTTPRHPRVEPVPATGNEGWIQELIDQSISGVGGADHLFRTLARNPVLFRRYLTFSARLFAGDLPPATRELVILRVAALCGSAYEWGQHVRIGADVGLSATEIDRVLAGPEAPGWSTEARVLLGAVDQMVTVRGVDDETWSALSETWNESVLIELAFLVGHYVMLAGVIGTLRIPGEPGLPGLPGRAAGAAGDS